MEDIYKLKPCWELIKTKNPAVILNLITGDLLKLKNLNKKENLSLKKLYKNQSIYGSELPSESLTKLKDMNLLEKDQKLKYPQGLDRQLDYLSAFETKRVSRKDIHERIVSKRIAVLGVGSMGQWILPSLVSGGFEKITLVDFDEVEERNIINQPLFSRKDIGRFKVDVVAEKLKDMNPNVKINPVNKKLLSVRDISSLCKSNDLVVHACDFPRFQIHNMITEACFMNKTPNLMVWPGKVGPFNIPYKTPCYGCVEERAKREFPFWESLKEKLQDTENRRFPALRVSTSIAGTIAAKEIFNWATGIFSPFTMEEMLYWDPASGRFKPEKIKRISSCPLCGENGR